MVTAVHSYDVPMILGVPMGTELAENMNQGLMYGYLSTPSFEEIPKIARKFVADRLVACAQISVPSDESATLTMKTLWKHKNKIDNILEGISADTGTVMHVEWQPAVANEAYAQWVRESVLG